MTFISESTTSTLAFDLGGCVSTLSTAHAFSRGLQPSHPTPPPPPLNVGLGFPEVPTPYWLRTQRPTCAVSRTSPGPQVGIPGS